MQPGGSPHLRLVAAATAAYAAAVALTAAPTVTAGGSSTPSPSFVASSAAALGSFLVPGSSFTVVATNSSSCGTSIALVYTGAQFATSYCGSPIVSTTFGTDTFPGEGNFFPTLVDSAVCNSGTLASIATSGTSLNLSGTLTGSSTSCSGLTWSLNLSVSPTEASELQFTATVSGPAGPARVIFTLASNSSEAFYGAGEQYTNFNLKGQSVPIVTTEQGIGRGLQPLSGIVNLAQKGAAGTSVTTYSAVPQFVSSALYAFFLRDFTAFANFDFSNSAYTVVRANLAAVKGSFIRGSSYLDIVKKYTAYSGRMQPVAEWTGNGIVLGIEGGYANINSGLSKVLAAGVPVSAIWVQDWCGQRNASYLGTSIQRLWWNWEYDRVLYPNWPQFVANLSSQQNIKTLVYVNPFLADVSTKATGFQVNYYSQAAAAGYLIKNSSGLPYLSTGSGFSVGLIDFTNPAAVSWLQSLIKTNVFDTGAAGYMADFGEYAPVTNAQLFSGADPAVYHNQYPDDWIATSQALTASYPDSLIFHRSSSAKSPGKLRQLWLGDQLTTFDNNDGLQSAITAMLTAGFSGLGSTHSDVGGYTIFTAFSAISIVTRSADLLNRWMEFGAFSPVFRSHPGLISSDLQIYSTAALLAVLKQTAGIFAALQPYRRAVLAALAETGAPYARPMVMQFPDDKALAGITWQQFMLGDALLVAVAATSGASSVAVVLPVAHAQWTELWTGKTWAGGATVTAAATAGKPPMFVPSPRTDGGLLDGLFKFVAASTA